MSEPDQKARLSVFFEETQWIDVPPKASRKKNKKTKKHHSGETKHQDQSEQKAHGQHPPELQFRDDQPDQHQQELKEELQTELKDRLQVVLEQQDLFEEQEQMMKIATDVIGFQEEESESDKEEAEEKKIQFQKQLEVEQGQVKRQQELQCELQLELQEKLEDILEERKHHQEQESVLTPRSERERQMSKKASPQKKKKKTSKKQGQINKDRPSLVIILFRETPSLTFKSLILWVQMSFSRIFIDPFFRALCHLINFMILALNWSSSWGEDFFFRTATDSSKTRILPRFFSSLKEMSEDLQDSKDTVKKNFEARNNAMSEQLQSIRKRSSDLKETIFDISYQARANPTQPQGLTHIFDLFLLMIFHMGMWVAQKTSQILDFLHIRRAINA